MAKGRKAFSDDEKRQLRIKKSYMYKELQNKLTQGNLSESQEEWLRARMKMIEEKDYWCRWCKKHFTRQNTWNEHQLLCDFADDSKIAPEALRFVIGMRQRLLEFKSQRTALRKMRRNYEGDGVFTKKSKTTGPKKKKAYPCKDPVCGKAFATSQKRAYHQWRVHGSGKYQRKDRQ